MMKTFTSELWMKRFIWGWRWKSKSKSKNRKIPKIIIKETCGKSRLFFNLPSRFGNFETNKNNEKGGWIEPLHLFVLRLPQVSQVSKTQWTWRVQKSSSLGNNGIINLPCAPPPIPPSLHFVICDEHHLSSKLINHEFLLL